MYFNIHFMRLDLCYGSYLYCLNFSAEGEDSKEEIELTPRSSSVSSTQGGQPKSAPKDQVDSARGPDNIEVDLTCT